MTTGIAAEMAGLAYAKPRQWTKTVGATNAPERFSRRAVTSMTRVGNVVTVACTAHGLQTGDSVRITGANEAEFNSTFKVTVVNANSFTIECLGQSASSTGTVVLDAQIFFRRAVLLGKKAARTVNATEVYYGAESTDDSQPFVVQPDGESKLEAPVGAKYALEDWYLDPVTAGDGLVMILT